MRRQKDISIHALCEEGDPIRASTSRSEAISIHALREEGDTISITGTCLADDFYPRPPRGGRRYNTSTGAETGMISIHALREEGD